MLQIFRLCNRMIRKVSSFIFIVFYDAHYVCLLETRNVVNSTMEELTGVVDNVISIPSFNNASNLSPSQADHEQDHNRIDTDNEASDDENDPTYEMSEESESSADEPNNDRS
ncbi:uncharacterized protein LOC128896523 isoform X1 [Hylaeus anthracinus]|uniref:uncharacterized protein LOC128896523 isoform X1 n=1 Tax=Hylaeus anthracinus TaxID=313031 RepID=UPI0023B9B188|nr:uncharacterized protein LOC128896523 isoform X1 [Hylaeus anthracinus]